MRVRRLHDVEVPDELEINVYGWRWPTDGGGENASKAVWLLANQEADRLNKPDSGFGCYRGRTRDDQWRYVWVVDVNRNVLANSPLLRHVPAELVEPDEATAAALVLRHLQRTADELERTGGPQVARESHWGLGLELDRFGRARIRVAGEE
jgi:hypothetical protein